MPFHSFAFLGFLIATLCLCLPLARRSVRAGKWLLLLASWVFYLWGFGSHALAGFAVLLAGAGVTVLTQRRLGGERDEATRRRVLFGAAAWHIGVLLVFKYTGFFTGGAVSLGFAPLGLSFFTFQQLWYLKAISAGEFAPQPAADFLLYAFFFPTVSSGPILRPQAFFPQLGEGTFLRPGGQDGAAGLYLFSIGLAKKVLLADAFAVLVNNGYAHPERLTAPGAWLVILGYTLQLYFDFSGYCDMATGVARLLGLRLPANFNSPYRALSVGDFWKRWHITLTTFLRECLYFPLGGSKRGTARTYGNILLVFCVSGLWHGAGWTFLLWGGLHGLAQIAERAWGPSRDRLPKGVRWAMTFCFVNLAWVLFRAPTVPGAVQVLSAAVSGGGGLSLSWLAEGLLSGEMNAVATLVPAWAGGFRRLAVAALYGTGLAAALWPQNALSRMDRFRPSAWRAVVCGILLGWSVLSFTGVTTFLYSNF
ncbi:MAG: MBOAT family O-acyltransferase [Oscillibacter sp.]